MRLLALTSLLSCVYAQHIGSRRSAWEQKKDVLLEDALPLDRVLKGSKGGGDTSTDGGEGTSTSGCLSPIAQAILAIPEAIVANPIRCCSCQDQFTVFVTHSEYNPNAATGFEIFWNSIYDEIDATSVLYGTCFVMTGYNQTLAPTKTLGEILIEVNTLVSGLEQVQVMMSTDPTDTLDLTNVIRGISADLNKPLIGVFNAGLPNLDLEAVISGQQRLQYIGYQQDSKYGSEAAAITLRLLEGTPATPLCFNGRPDLTFVGRRCAAYYRDVTDNPPDRIFGITCRPDSSVSAILALILETNATAVYATVDCCLVVAQATEMARNSTGTTIIAGCQDENTAGQLINFVVKQPIELEGYQTASWGILPVTGATTGITGRGTEFFPSLLSFVNTEVFSELVF